MTSPVQRQHGREEIWEAMWVRVFLETTFSNSCSKHEAPCNELKRYCIDCQIPACMRCINERTHAEHRVLKVYRYSMNATVLQSEMKEHIDCSKIQAYTCNREPVLALNPLPCRGSQRSEEGVCDTCTRKLLNPTLNCYCSIACKLEAFSKKENDLDTLLPEVQGPSQEGKRKRSRKGVPRRASYEIGGN